MRRIHFLSLLLISLTTQTSFGLITAYVSFDQPEGWRCELSQGVWICQSNTEPDRKESVVLSIATMATEWDSIENYEDYLKQPRNLQDEEGHTLTSEVRYVRKRNINGSVWVDSLQYNSELPGFWARYLATVHTTPKTKLAILITYVVSDERYAKLATVFERMVSSLKPNAEFDLNIPSLQKDGPLPGSTKLGSVIHDTIASRLKKPGKEPVKKEEPPSDNSTLFILVGVGAIAALILLRRRRKKNAATHLGVPPERRPD